MKKQLHIIILLGFTSMGVLAKEAPKWNGAPVFEGDFLKMRASMTRCGGVTIVSKTGKNVQLQSRLFKPSWVFGSTAKPKDILTKKKGWVELPPGGLRSKYGWPGKGGYFTVACQYKMSVECGSLHHVQKLLI